VKPTENGLQPGAGVHRAPGVDGSVTLIVYGPAAPGVGEIAKLPVKVPFALIVHGGDETLKRGRAAPVAVNVHDLVPPRWNPPPVTIIGLPIVP
jgi:hypothetical protein